MKNFILCLGIILLSTYIDCAPLREYQKYFQLSRFCFNRVLVLVMNAHIMHLHDVPERAKRWERNDEVPEPFEFLDESDGETEDYEDEELEKVLRALEDQWSQIEDPFKIDLNRKLRSLNPVRL